MNIESEPLMSTPLQPVTQSSNPAFQANNSDVYSRMVKNAVEDVIEDVILIDASSPSDAAEICACGNCGKADFELVGDSEESKLAGAPLFYIETRSNSDPLLLDELTISADLESLTLPRNVTTELPLQQVLASSLDDETFNEMDTIAQMIFAAAPAQTSPIDDDYSASFNPSSFNPFDPHIDEDTDLSIAS